MRPMCLAISQPFLSAAPGHLAPWFSAAEPQPTSTKSHVSTSPQPPEHCLLCIMQNHDIPRSEVAWYKRLCLPVTLHETHVTCSLKYRLGLCILRCAELHPDVDVAYFCPASLVGYLNSFSWKFWAKPVAKQ